MHAQHATDEAVVSELRIWHHKGATPSKLLHIDGQIGHLRLQVPAYDNTHYLELREEFPSYESLLSRYGRFLDLASLKNN